MAESRELFRNPDVRLEYLLPVADGKRIRSKSTEMEERVVVVVVVSELQSGVSPLPCNWGTASSSNQPDYNNHGNGVDLFWGSHHTSLILFRPADNVCVCAPVAFAALFY